MTKPSRFNHLPPAFQNSTLSKYVKPPKTTKYEQRPANLPTIPRLCLGCDKAFPSICVSNRICDECKGEDAWRNLSELPELTLVAKKTKAHGHGSD